MAESSGELSRTDEATKGDDHEGIEELLDSLSGPTARLRNDSILNKIMSNGRAVQVDVERRDATIHLSGTVSTDAERNAAIGASSALLSSDELDASELLIAGGTAGRGRQAAGSAVGEAAKTERASALQTELKRTTAVTPLIFKRGESKLNELQIRILNNIASTLQACPDVAVTIVGFTDGRGTDEDNLQLSLARAGAVMDYLVSQGMVDALQTVEAERGNIEVSVTENAFVPAEAAKAIEGYVAQNYDLIIAHGVEFAGELIEIVEANPNIAFAWGTETETFGLPNLYAYDAAAEQGAYVMGAMSTALSSSNVLGVEGPIEVGDAKRYVNGFQAGASSQTPSPEVLVIYTGSFADIGFAAEAANAHADQGADVLTGTAEMVVGAVSVASERDALWFGTQADQTSLAPSIVVASQVYHWEVLLHPIIADVDNATINGRGEVADMANGGLAISYNPEFDLPPEVRQLADELTEQILSGALVVSAD